MNEPLFATVNEDGILEIPKEILDEYGWELGTEFNMEVLDNGNIKLTLHDPTEEDQ
jgi:bifunctional DNA-binding transcriptional regulator/antitoxin component of YhaV-PrlF toxin-antitoxin module